ncbi:hypothetical protein V8C37DRAFT_382198 [Trichoderma ceciliae]
MGRRAERMRCKMLGWASSFEENREKKRPSSWAFISRLATGTGTSTVDADQLARGLEVLIDSERLRYHQLTYKFKLIGRARSEHQGLIGIQASKCATAQSRKSENPSKCHPWMAKSYQRVYASRSPQILFIKVGACPPSRAAKGHDARAAFFAVQAAYVFVPHENLNIALRSTLSKKKNYMYPKVHPRDEPASNPAPAGRRCSCRYSCIVTSFTSLLRTGLRKRKNFPLPFRVVRDPFEITLGWVCQIRSLLAPLDRDEVHAKTSPDHGSV